MLFEAAQTSRGIATVFMRLCCIAEWLVGESGRTIRKPLCHELVKLLDALVAGEGSSPFHQPFEIFTSHHNVATSACTRLSTVSSSSHGGRAWALQTVSVKLCVILPELDVCVTSIHFRELP